MLSKFLFEQKKGAGNVVHFQDLLTHSNGKVATQKKELVDCPPVTYWHSQTRHRRMHQAIQRWMRLWINGNK